MYKITAPVAGYSGVKAGVRFVDGTAETDRVRAVNYFRRHGYDIAEAEAEEKPKRRNSRKAKDSDDASPAARPGLDPPANGEGADASSSKEEK